MENSIEKDKFPKTSTASSDPDLVNSPASTNNSAGETGEGPSGIRGGGTDLSQGADALGVPANLTRNENNEDNDSRENNDASSASDSNDPNSATWSEHPSKEMRTDE